MKRLSSIFILSLISLAPSVGVSAQTKTKVKCTFRSGCVLEMDVSKGKIVSFNYDCFYPVNKSFHECSVEAKRADKESEWQWQDSNNNTTTITSAQDGDKQTIVIKSSGNKYNITTVASCLPKRLTITLKGHKYVGRILAY